MNPDPASTHPRRRAGRERVHPLQILLGTAVGYTLLGLLALQLLGSHGYAIPLFPAAGLALAAAAVYRQPALLGVWLGSALVNGWLGWQQAGGEPALTLLLLPLVLGAGAALQAWAGASLLRRFVSQPLVLHQPRDIVLAGLLGALLASLVSASVSTLLLLGARLLSPSAWADHWLTWWTGDAMGALIAAPLVLTLIGRPRTDWRPRRRALGLPLVVGLALVGAVVHQVRQLDERASRSTFERGVDRLAAEAQQRLDAPLYALQTLRSVALAENGLSAHTLREASAWWLAQPLQLQAVGYSVRVPNERVEQLEAAARAEGLSSYRVFDRDDGQARRADGEVLALRLIEPMQGNAGALGVNALSIPAARAAILRTRDSGQPAATAAFRLTQASGDESGIVLYQALYDGAPQAPEARREAFRGLVFVTLRIERAWAELHNGELDYLGWCVVDPAPGVERVRVAGPPGCETPPRHARPYEASRSLFVAGRTLELRAWTSGLALPSPSGGAAGILALGGLAATALLGALLLTITGHHRRTELAVQAATSQLRREMAERAHAESALRDSEQRLRNILDHLPIGVMFANPQGYLLDCNPRLCEMLGISADELRGRSVLQLVRPEESTRVHAQRARLLAGAAETMLDHVRLATTDGRELVVRVTVTGLRGPDGRVLRMVAVMQDITELLRLQASETALQRAEAGSRAKSEFVSRMSHELRTPLNAMLGFAQLLGLDRDPALSTRQQEWVRQIQRAGWHLLEMINETLDLARIESGAVRLTVAALELRPLLAACRDLVAAPAQQRHVEIHEHIADDALALRGDATRVKQVLTNLLSNAVKYNRVGGQVDIEVRRIGGQIEVAVRDTGLGMTPSQLGALFQPYNRLGREQSGIEGTGIGLVIAKRLTELMGGTLEVSSQAGEGSTFTLRLPAADDWAPTPPRFTDTSPAPYHRRRVHYVEDNATNLEIMRGVLIQRPQIDLTTSALGLDGLAAIRRDPPDLILLDMQLPDISGLELLRHLKDDDALAAIPVIVVSADATPARMQQALTLGALHYVTKPLEVAPFLNLLDQALEELDTHWGT